MVDIPDAPWIRYADTNGVSSYSCYDDNDEEEQGDGEDD